MRVIHLAALAIAPILTAATSNTGAPDYSAATILNSYAGVAGMYAPNSFISILGTNLSFVTAVITAEDLQGGVWPTALPGTNVRVLINNIPASMIHVAPTQVDIMIPPLLIAGPATLVVVNNGLAGPSVKLTLDDTAPVMLHVGGGVILAVHRDWTRVTLDSPAHPGEFVVLYAVGLGPTVPAQISNRLPDRAASIQQLPDFHVWLNGVPVDASRIPYAGISPPYPGIFQINIFLPNDAPADPEIRVGFSVHQSLPGGILPLR
jgi:uncharacterized protein (TIGR03437 family)